MKFSRLLSLAVILVASSISIANAEVVLSTSAGGGGGGSVSVTAGPTSNIVISPTPGTGTFTVDTAASLTTSGITVNGNTALDGTTTLAGPVVLTSTAKGFPFPEIPLRATTTDATGDITPANYTPAGASTNGFIGIPDYALAASVTGAAVNLSLSGALPHIIPQGTLYLRQTYETAIAATVTNTDKATVSDAVISNNGGLPFTTTMHAETQTVLGVTTTDALTTVDTALTSTATIDSKVIINYQLNQTTSPGISGVWLSLVIY